jgi:hypothetical protein
MQFIKTIFCIIVLYILICKMLIFIFKRLKIAPDLKHFKFKELKCPQAARLSQM